MKYGKEITKEISGYLEKGSGRVDATVLAGICYDSFLEWMKKPEFSEAVKIAETKCKQRNIDIIQKAAKRTWTAAAWWLERKHKDEFALKQNIEHSGMVSQSVPPIIRQALDIVKAKESVNGK